MDCTSDGPFDYLGTFTQDKDAFIVDANKSRFIKTPALLGGDMLQTRKVKVEYGLLEAQASFENSYKGEMYEKILHLESNYNESDKSMILRNYFVEDGFDLKNYQLAKPYRDSLKIDLAYK